MPHRTDEKDSTLSGLNKIPGLRTQGSACGATLGLGPATLLGLEKARGS